MKKEIIAGLLCILIIFIAFQIFFKAEEKAIPELKPCIDKLKEKKLKPNKDFHSGFVVVGFKNETTLEEAKDIIASYNLKWPNREYSLWDINVVLVEVPKDSEFEWICKLKENSKIEYVELNIISKVRLLDVVPSQKTIKLNMTITPWSSWGLRSRQHKTESSIIEVREGEEFGPTDSDIVDISTTASKPFKLLKIIDENNIKVQFDGSLVIVGEYIEEPSKQNPKIISREETCFNTRTYDGGVNYCLKIIN